MLAHTLRNLARTEPIRLVTGAGALFACRVSGAAIGYVTLIALARWMGANELGTYVFAYSWCITLTMVATLGYPGAAFRFIGLGLTQRSFNLIRGFVRRGRQIIIGSGILLTTGGATIVLATPLLSSADRIPFVIALTCIPIFGLVRLNTTVAHAFSWFALAIAPNALVRPLLLFVAITLMWLAGVELSAVKVLLAFMGALAIIALTQHSILAVRLERRLGNPRPAYQTRRWVRTGLPLLIVMAFTGYFPEVSVIIAGAYLPAEEIAKLNAGLRTAFLIAFGLDAVDNIILPRVSRLFAQGDTSGLQRLVTRATHLKFWSALAAVLAFSLLGKQILGWFGEPFTEGFGALLIFSLALLARAAVGPVAMLLMASGQQDRCIVVYTCALFLHLLLNVLLVPRLGINGAALAMLATTLVWTIWLRSLVIRHVGIRPSILAAAGYRCRDTN